MISYKRKVSFVYRIISCFVAFTFAFTTILSPAYAQSINLLNLPIPGTMVAPTPAFVPVLLKGMTIHPEDPLRFDFIVDSGHTGFTLEEVRIESQKLVKYFLASLTVPQNDLWVNLSPYEEDRVIPVELGKTELGRDLLAQDYILKQLTASLMYPEEELGQKFWNKVRKKAQEQYGTTDIPVNTFNKVWILPESATVYEHGQTVYVVQSRLKVMLDSDYEAMQQETKDHRPESIDSTTMELGESIIREIIIPEIEKEVNHGKNFAPLRQIYHSLILAKWYKETIKESLLSQVYVDQNKVAGVESSDATVKDQIYDRYMQAYKKGVYNYIKEDYDALSQEVIPRKYFSGGFKDRDIAMVATNDYAMISRSAMGDQYYLRIDMEPQRGIGDAAMMAGFPQEWQQFPYDIDFEELGARVRQERGQREIKQLAKEIVPLLSKMDQGNAGKPYYPRGISRAVRKLERGNGEEVEIIRLLAITNYFGITSVDLKLVGANFKNNLRQIMESNKITSEQMEEVIGKNGPMVRLFRTGRHFPSVKQFKGIIQALGDILERPIPGSQFLGSSYLDTSEILTGEVLDIFGILYDLWLLQFEDVSSAEILNAKLLAELKEVWQLNEHEMEQIDQFLGYWLTERMSLEEMESMSDFEMDDTKKTLSILEKLGIISLATGEPKITLEKFYATKLGLEIKRRMAARPIIAHSYADIIRKVYDNPDYKGEWVTVFDETRRIAFGESFKRGFLAVRFPIPIKDLDGKYKNLKVKFHERYLRLGGGPFKQIMFRINEEQNRIYWKGYRKERSNKIKDHLFDEVTESVMRLDDAGKVTLERIVNNGDKADGAMTAKKEGDRVQGIGVSDQEQRAMSKKLAKPADAAMMAFTFTPEADKKDATLERIQQLINLMEVIDYLRNSGSDGNRTVSGWGDLGGETGVPEGGPVIDLGGLKESSQWVSLSGGRQANFNETVYALTRILILSQKSIRRGYPRSIDSGGYWHWIALPSRYFEDTFVVLMDVLKDVNTQLQDWNEAKLSFSEGEQGEFQLQQLQWILSDLLVPKDIQAGISRVTLEKEVAGAVDQAQPESEDYYLRLGLKRDDAHRYYQEDWSKLIRLIAQEVQIRNPSIREVQDEQKTVGHAAQILGDPVLRAHYDHMVPKEETSGIPAISAGKITDDDPDAAMMAFEPAVRDTLQSAFEFAGGKADLITEALILDIFYGVSSHLKYTSGELSGLLQGILRRHGIDEKAAISNRFERLSRKWLPELRDALAEEIKMILTHKLADSERKMLILGEIIISHQDIFDAEDVDRSARLIAWIGNSVKEIETKFVEYPPRIVFVKRKDKNFLIGNLPIVPEGYHQELSAAYEHFREIGKEDILIDEIDADIHNAALLTIKILHSLLDETQTDVAVEKLIQDYNLNATAPHFTLLLKAYNERKKRLIEDNLEQTLADRIDRATRRLKGLRIGQFVSSQDIVSEFALAPDVVATLLKKTGFVPDKDRRFYKKVGELDRAMLGYGDLARIKVDRKMIKRILDNGNSPKVAEAIQHLMLNTPELIDVINKQRKRVGKVARNEQQISILYNDNGRLQINMDKGIVKDMYEDVYRDLERIKAVYKIDYQNEKRIYSSEEFFDLNLVHRDTNETLTMRELFKQNGLQKAIENGLPIERHISFRYDRLRGQLVTLTDESSDFLTYQHIIDYGPKGEFDRSGIIVIPRQRENKRRSNRLSIHRQLYSDFMSLHFHPPGYSNKPSIEDVVPLAEGPGLILTIEGEVKILVPKSSGPVDIMEMEREFIDDYDDALNKYYYQSDFRVEFPDRAMVGDVIEHKTQVTSHTTPGGIDLNEIEVDRQGAGVNIQFDPKAFEPMLNMQIDGFAPIIINITPIPSVLPLLGLEPQREEELEVSRLN